MMTLGSLFDGIAGFPLAAANQGIKTVWTSEIEPNCIDIAKRHFPEAVNLGDITKINGAGIPEADIISFGSPCQDLSVAGKRAGITGERSGLFMEAVRIIREMRLKTNGKYPKYILWENVAGAFSSNKGEDFRRVLEEITESRIPMPAGGRWAAAGMVGVKRAGGVYHTFAWRKLDAQFWGVPQRRKRIYLVGDLAGGRAGQILFECESLLGYPPQGGEEGKGNTCGLKDSPAGADCGRMGRNAGKQMRLDLGHAGDRIYINAEKSVTLTGMGGGCGAKTGLYLLPVYTIAGNIINRDVRNGGNQMGIGRDTAPTLTCKDRHAVAYAQSGYGGYTEGVGTLTKSRGAAGGGSETFAVCTEGSGAGVKHRVRRLTPLECERLQGFPEGWTKYGASGKEMSDNARYRALGNSIAVPCAERVFIGINAAEKERRYRKKQRNEGGKKHMQITATFDSLEEMTTFAKGFISREKEKKPVTEVSVEKPVTEIASEEAEPVAEEEPEPTEETYTLAEVRARLAQLSKAGKKEQVQELINSFGVDKLSKIPEEKYPEVMRKAGEL